MDVKLLKNEAIVLFDFWDLNDWEFRLGKRLRALGICRYSDKVIEVSEWHATHDSAEHVLDTLKHEIAHAITYKRYGRTVEPHGPEWKAAAREVGCSPLACEATAEGVALSIPPGKYYSVCGGCSHRFEYYRKLKRLEGRYCTKCGPDKGSLVIKKY